MTQYSEPKQNKGFTLIELVVVIAILAILAAFALPRFAQLSQQAHDSSVEATTGALAAGVALAKTQWVSNGLTVATANVAGFGNDTIDVSANGWAVSTSGNTDPATLTAAECVEVWEGLLQASAPSVATAIGSDYLANASSGTCTYAYQLDGGTTAISYNATNGDVTNNL
ncbi:prepilin-type N-terminal cleavage/methylation domain-containing protein [Marinobacter salinisoli]|uniref:Prepilin-type N-terminal cleavage/methylation domain-containing protein n=1 Tax=Marinobacter salinisoli TaxID=2769486 RepID=A0ABX7MX23_9GAMM|nr:prepilin-type N-terminal cleavage/methylation domain-containing protein [Marinobacter salinisoli]QSP96032.1 prepilin-type N-terminal cleavage/methylation domain-containing protein [Marinobacter salinisoli]